MKTQKTQTYEEAVFEKLEEIIETISYHFDEHPNSRNSRWGEVELPSKFACRLAVQALQIVKLEYETANATNKFADFDWEQARAEAVVDTAGAERVLHQIEEMTR